MKITLHEGHKSFQFNLLPSSIRYFRRNEFHAYGRKTSFELTFTTPKGTRLRRYFSDIGTSQQAAFNNALRTLLVYKDL